MMRAKTFSAVAAFSAALALSPAQAEEFASPPSKGTVSSARLLSAGPMQAGAYRAGVELDLAPQTVTYWRQPGEAGSPPAFDFSKSVNVAKVETAFPLPKHIEEAGTVVAAYDAKVIFPLKVTPQDPQKPVTLALALDYAACGKICLPAKANLALELPRAGVSPYAADIVEAQKRVPEKLDAAQAKKRLAVKKEGGALTWRLSYRGPGKAQDIFAEAPDPLFIESKKDGADFILTLFANGARADKTAAVVTIVTDRGAFEAPLRLD